jgi:hypothetical protein
VASDLQANVSSLAALAGGEGQMSGAVGVKASPELLWPCGAKRREELCRVVAKPRLATHLHVSFCLLEDTDCQCTRWVGHSPPTPACAGPHTGQCFLSQASLCPLSSRPQSRPLRLQELASPCNVLILIKVQTGFGVGEAQVWDEKGTGRPHPYCMPPPFPSTFSTYNRRQCTLQITPTHALLRQGTQHQPWGEAPRGPP